MGVIRAQISDGGRLLISARCLPAAMPALFFFLIFAGLAPALRAQQSNPSSANNVFYGSVTAHPATDEVLKLSLDDAVRRGLETNLGLKEAENEERYVHGQKNEAL